MAFKQIQHLKFREDFLPNFKVTVRHQQYIRAAQSTAGRAGRYNVHAPEDDQTKLSNKFRLRDTGTKHGKIHP